MVLLFEQLFIPLWDTELAVCSIQFLKSLVEHVSIVELCCDITDDSIYKTYEIISEHFQRIGANNEN